MNVNMSGMNSMGGPVGGGGGNLAGPMMNNGVAGRMPSGSVGTHHGDSQQRAHLNTYIYEYFLKNEMFDCARAMLASKQPINVVDKNSSRRRDDNGNVLGNGVSDDSMDTDNKDSLDMKRNEDLPVPPRNPLSEECPDACFLFDWWCLFWDMFQGQHGKSGRDNIVPFINHTQGERQQAALRNLNPAQAAQQLQYQQMIMRNQQQNNDLARVAMNNNNRSKPTPQQMQMMQQQKQMQQNGAEIDGNRQRPQSPGSAENAPSPSKRPRLENGPFPIQQGMPNGRGQSQVIPGQDQLQAFPNGNPNRNAIQKYATSLSQQQKTQIPGGMPVGASPANQGSPMMMENGSMFDPNYNVPNNGRGGPQPGGAAGQGNHALQDYQMQLMLLEQQNKKRLMIARQEQDNMGGNMRQEGGQQYQGASPNGPRSGASPNPNEMKRGTPQMGQPGSPLPDGQSRGSPHAMGFNPGHMDPNTAPAFYNNSAIKGMEAGAMGQVMPNGMRPPSSHPTGFNGQPMTQQMIQARQQQQGGGQFPAFQGGPNGAPMMIQQQSQGGGPPPQGMGTPQQRAMPPPQAPAVGNAPNGQNNNRSNTQPSSPQQPAAPPTPSQSNKAAPGKGKKNDKEPRKRPTKKGSIATLNSGATPSADAAGAGNEGPATTPTPATPVTPLHPNSLRNGQGNQQGAQGAPGGQQGANNGGMNGQGQQGNGGQATAPPLTNAVQPQPIHQSMDPSYSLDQIDMSSLGEFGAGFGLGGQPGDPLEHFDFDSFLNNEPGDNADGGFNFDTSNFGLEGEVGVE